MKRLLLAATTVGMLLLAVAFSGSQTPTKPPAAPVGELQVEVNGRNPWTHLRVNNDPSDFRFAIVSDRTGGHRAKIFSRAIDQLNLMQPEFVVSVGDLIEGYKEDPEKVAAEWREFQSYVHRLQMPFFYVPGNHDVANPYLRKQWEEKFGKTYYHFVYRDVLFLVLNSNDAGKTEGIMSAEQIAWAKKVLEQNTSRWTIVLLHNPLWAVADIEKSGFHEIEKALGDRPYTVFAGHVHRYQKFVRNGRNYYQLATTGGSSKIRGLRYGEFDHIAWITMKKDGPTIANVMLDGIYPEDMRLPASEELGTEITGRKATAAVKGTVFLDGCPLPDARITFYDVADPKKPARRADAIADVDATFVMSSYTAFDGVPPGDYVVTVTATGPNKVPAHYAKPETSVLKVTVTKGANEFTLELKK
jgi:3',5'-cyclic AMP phosphodiesterase CpdA